MSSRALFQVIALVTTPAPRAEQIRAAMGDAFGLDLGPFSQELEREGVCIQHALTLDDAQRTANKLQGLGADYRILDASGQIVAQAQGDAEAPAPAEPEGLDLLQTPMASGNMLAPESALELDDDRSFTLQDSVDPAANTSDSLIMLDGTEMEVGQDKQADDMPGVYGAPNELPELDQGQPFAGDLELDKTPMPRFEEAETAPEVETDDSATVQPTPQLADPLDLGDAAPLPAEQPAPADEEPAPGPEPAADPADQSTRKRADTASLRDQLDAINREQPAPARSSAPAPRSRAYTGAARPSGRGSEMVLFDGWFRRHSRLRLVVGMLLALGLGSVAPAIHAGRVYQRAFDPLRQELSTARANEARPHRAPSIRRSGAVEEALDNLRWKYFIYTTAIWLACGGVVALLWFKFC